MADQFADFSATPTSYGTKGVVITPDNSTDIDPFPKAVEVSMIAGGTTLKVLPSGNADGEWLEYSPVFVGFRPSFRVRRVHTDTNCTVVSVRD